MAEDIIQSGLAQIEKLILDGNKDVVDKLEIKIEQAKRELRREIVAVKDELKKDIREVKDALDIHIKLPVH